MKEESPITIAGINATMIAILIAIVSAYLIYTFDIIQDIEINALFEAKKINKIYFSRSYYVPKPSSQSKKITWSDNIYMTLEMAGSKIGQRGVKNATDHVEISIPENSDDIKELMRYLEFLIMPDVFTAQGRDKSIGAGKYIPDDPAKRAEEILKVIYVIGHCYLFPEALFNSDGVFKKELPKKIYFGNIDNLRQWLNDTNELLFQVKKIKYTIYHHGSPNKYFNALKEQEKIFFDKWKTSHIFQIFGHVDPDFLYEEFFSNMEKIEDIANSAEYNLNRADKFRKGLPGKYLIAVGLFAAFIVFTFGTFFPLMFLKTNQLLQLRLPALFYILAFGYIIFFVLNKIWD